MRVVADANIVLSALPWGGAPRALLDSARHGRIALFTGAALMAELEDVLSRPKPASRVATPSFMHSPCGNRIATRRGCGRNHPEDHPSAMSYAGSFFSTAAFFSVT